MQGSIKIEVCVGSVESAIEAERGGADRVELCDNLFEGGTTPSAGYVMSALRHLSVAVNVMIRPRGGDFCYSDIEFDIMKRDVSMAKDLKCDGVVFGILKPDGRVDLDRCRELIELARPLSVTFHRAFDMTSDPFQALDDIVLIGCDRILTSGQKNKAPEGVDMIAELVARANDDIIIMPGSGVNEDTIGGLIRQTQAKEYHVACRKNIDSAMIYRNPNVSMGGTPEVPEYAIPIIDRDRIEAVVKEARQNRMET